MSTDDTRPRVWWRGGNLIVARRYGACFDELEITATGADWIAELSTLPDRVVELHPAPAPVAVREDETVPWLKREVDQMGTAILRLEYEHEFQKQIYSRLLRGMARRAAFHRERAAFHMERAESVEQEDRCETCDGTGMNFHGGSPNPDSTGHYPPTSDPCDGCYGTGSKSYREGWDEALRAQAGPAAPEASDPTPVPHFMHTQEAVEDELRGAGHGDMPDLSDVVFVATSAARRALGVCSICDGTGMYPADTEADGYPGPEDCPPCDGTGWDSPSAAPVPASSPSPAEVASRLSAAAEVCEKHQHHGLAYEFSQIASQLDEDGYSNEVCAAVAAALSGEASTDAR